MRKAGASMLSLLALTTAQAQPVAEPPTKRVLVVYWYDKDYPVNVALDRGLRRTLFASQARVELYTEYLETNRFPEQQAESLREYLRSKYVGTPIDVVVGSGVAVVDFLLEHRRELFPATPMVFIGGLSRTVDVAAAPGITGVAAYRDFRKGMDLALRLQPGTERAYVISGTRERDRRLENRAREMLATLQDSVEIRYLTDLSLHDLMLQVKSVPARSVILYAWQQLENQGRVLESEDILSSIAPLSPVPIFGMAETGLGRGVVGGEIFTNEASGARAAAMVLSILGGTPAPRIPVEGAPTTPIFDWRQLQRWKIPQERLPDGSVILFRDPTFWQSYRWYILAALIVCAVQTALIAALLLQRRSRRRAELEAARRQRELTHLSRIATIGELTGKLAHEMRQPLMAIRMNAQAARLSLSRSSAIDRAELTEALDDIVQFNERAAAVIDRLRGLLRRSDAETARLSLNDVVADSVALASMELNARGVTVVTTLSPSIPLVVGDRVELQQVLLNLLINASDAMGMVPPDKRIISVRTEVAGDGTAQVSVSDHGHGIPEASLDRVFDSFFTTKENGLGLGLAICRTIIGKHRGRIWCSSDDEGATFRIALPVSEEAAATPVATPPWRLRAPRVSPAPHSPPVRRTPER
jgi:signal transduction histidine kinase